MEDCVKCGKNNFLWVCSEAGDNNYYKWNDKETKDGHLPQFSTICDFDGCSMTICIECGWIVGLNLKDLKANVKKTWAKKEIIIEKETKLKSSTAGLKGGDIVLYTDKEVEFKAKVMAVTSTTKALICALTYINETFNPNTHVNTYRKYMTIIKKMI